MVFFVTADAQDTERAGVAIGPGVRLTAVLTGVEDGKPEKRPRLSIGVKRAGQVEKKLGLEFTPDKYPQFKDVIEASFFWGVETTAVKLGDKQVARVGLYGRTGEDLMVIDEIAILVDVDDMPRVLWLGPGDRQTNDFDVCLVNTKARFRLTEDGRLERRTRSKKYVAKVPKGDDMMLYVRRCKAPEPKVEVFPLSAVPGGAGSGKTEQAAEPIAR
jgi:hypothetical protein